MGFLSRYWSESEGLALVDGAPFCGARHALKKDWDVTLLPLEINCGVTEITRALTDAEKAVVAWIVHRVTEGGCSPDEDEFASRRG